MGKQVGIFIREMREKRGLSQGDVARLLKLKTAQSISNIERGVSPLPRTKIKRLADILGIRKSEIVTIVLREVQDRYSKVVGVQGGSILVSSGLKSDEFELLQGLAERLRESKSGQRAVLKKQMRKIVSYNA
ncbi:MAG: helix-turn-helix transcriptional regulator [Bdellovibrionota bacterium]